MKIHSVGAKFCVVGQTDLTKLIVAFCNFANIPENSWNTHKGLKLRQKERVKWISQSQWPNPQILIWEGTEYNLIYIIYLFISLCWREMELTQAVKYHWCSLSFASQQLQTLCWCSSLRLHQTNWISGWLALFGGCIPKRLALYIEDLRCTCWWLQRKLFWNVVG
jgi:hypothetical protein